MLSRRQNVLAEEGTNHPDLPIGQRQTPLQMQRQVGSMMICLLGVMTRRQAS